MKTIDKVKAALSSFKDWHILFKNSQKNSDFEKLSFSMMLKIASSLKEWKEVYKYAPNKETRQVIFLKIIEKSDSFDQLYEISKGGWIDHNNIAITKLLKNENLTFDQLKKTYYLRKGDYLKEIILKKMMEKATTPEELFWVIKLSKKYEAIYQEASILLEKFK